MTLADIDIVTISLSKNTSVLLCLPVFLFKLQLHLQILFILSCINTIDGASSCLRPAAQIGLLSVLHLHHSDLLIKVISTSLLHCVRLVIKYLFEWLVD